MNQRNNPKPTTNPSPNTNTPDPLIALFEKTAAEAAKNGLTPAEVEAELAAYNAERRA